MTPDEKRELVTKAHEALTQLGHSLRLGALAELIGEEPHRLAKVLPARGKITRVGHGTYAAWTPSQRPTSGAATNDVRALDGTVLVNVGSQAAPTFRFLLVLDDGEILLQDQDKNVWKATLL